MTTETKTRHQPLALFEQETIINFNKGETTAYIFTYEKTWQRRLESLGYKPTMNNGRGGKEYQVPKDRVPMPRAKRRVSEATKKKMTAVLARARVAKQGILITS